MADFGADPIAESENTIIHASEIEEAIYDACLELGIDDLANACQGPFKAVLYMVGKRLFPDKKRLKDNTNVQANHVIKESTLNRYNYSMLDSICDYYIYMLCNRYKKLVSIESFALLVNINRDTIERWKDNEPSSISFGIYKKLIGHRENSLKDKAFDSSNVVGTIAIANNEFGWSAATVRKETQAKQEALTLDALPQLQQIESNIIQSDSKNIHGAQ